MGASIVTVDLYFETVTCSILLVMYMAVMVRAVKGSEFKFVIQLCVLLMLYNFSSIARKWFFEELVH